MVTAAGRGVRAVAFGAVAGLALAGWRRRGATARRRRAGHGPARADLGRSPGRSPPGAPPAPQARAGVDDVPDDVLVERVRAQAAVPAGVEVVMTEGAIVLFGRVPRFELEPLLRRAAQVEGVSAVENRLTAIDLPPSGARS